VIGLFGLAVAFAAQRTGRLRDRGGPPWPASAHDMLAPYLDEAGQSVRPPKARTWAPRGHTVVVAVSGKSSGRVSVAGLVCLKPGRRGRLFDRVLVHHGQGERRSFSEDPTPP
jgi:hypothetical protein